MMQARRERRRIVVAHGRAVNLRHAYGIMPSRPFMDVTWSRERAWVRAWTDHGRCMGDLLLAAQGIWNEQLGRYG